ncbi:MAG TPA: hypothetical protein ENI23_01725 [bacterium]|nr:hypothetical protein [bacterium]
MKAIIIGASLSGKTTIIKKLKGTSINIIEMDEELTRLNEGVFPANHKDKMKIARKAIKSLLAMKGIVFFTNTDYFTVKDLSEAREKGFKIIQLEVSLEELLKRNGKRVREEGYQDMSEWLPGMVEYQKETFQLGLIDKKLNGEDRAEDIVRDIETYLTNEL